MSQALQQKLKDRWDSFTASEQKIANYLLHHLRDLPFETAASLSKRVGVSPMTMGRFLRTMGYDGVGELKDELRDKGSWQRLYRGAERQEGRDSVEAHLQAEINELTAVHALTGTREWNAVVKLLANANRVSVASFQNGGFLGQNLAGLLQQLRPRVSFNTGADGAYIDLLLDSDRHSCVVLIDARRYFKQFRSLATEVAKRGIPLLLIVDTDCYWAAALTPHVLSVPVDRLWHSYSAYTSLFSLLTASVHLEIGDVMQRMGDINHLREELVGYVDSRATDGNGARNSAATPAARRRGAHSPLSKLRDEARGRRR